MLTMRRALMLAKRRPLARSFSSAPPFCPVRRSTLAVLSARSPMSVQLPSEFVPSSRTCKLLTGIVRNDTYLYMGGPLLAGVTVVALSSLAPMALPLGMRGLAITEAISLYGGLAVFSGFVLYEYVLLRATQRSLTC